ncbi:hypothetical protein ATER59S_01872 [Aquamicrobium terrae]
MWAGLIRLLTGDVLGSLTRAYEAKLRSDNEADRLVADALSRQIDAVIAQQRESAEVVKAGMQHKAFWVPWLIAAVPTTLWYAWGMADSMLYAGALLPDVAALPPQLKEYADIIFHNIFYVGGGVATATTLANAIRGRK